MTYKSYPEHQSSFITPEANASWDNIARMAGGIC